MNGMQIVFIMLYINDITGLLLKGQKAMYTTRDFFAELSRFSSVSPHARRSLCPL